MTQVGKPTPTPVPVPARRGNRKGSVLLKLLRTPDSSPEPSAGRAPVSGLSTAVVALAGALTLATIARGPLQARSMTRLRQQALGQSSDEPSAYIRRSARHASLLHALIGVLSLTLLILVALLTTRGKQQQLPKTREVHWLRHRINTNHTHRRGNVATTQGRDTR